MVECLSASTLEQREDRDYVIDSLKHASYCREQLQYAGDVLKNDEEVAKLAITRDAINFQYASPKIRDNLEISSLAIEGIPSYKVLQVARYMGSTPRDNEKIILAAIAKDCDSLQYASPRLQDKDEVVLAAVKDEASCLKYASSRLKGSEEIAIMIAKEGYASLKHMNLELRNNEKAMKSVININPDALQYVGAELAGNEQFIAGLISHQPYLLRNLSGAMQNSKMVVLNAIIADSNVWGYASREIQDDTTLQKVKDCIGDGFARWFSRDLDCDHSVPLDVIQMLGREDDMTPAYLEIHGVTQNEEDVATDLEAGQGIEDQHSDL